MDTSSSLPSGSPVHLVLGVETNAPSMGNWTQKLVFGEKASNQGGGALVHVRCACT